MDLLPQPSRHDGAAVPVRDSLSSSRQAIAIAGSATSNRDLVWPRRRAKPSKWSPCSGDCQRLAVDRESSNSHSGRSRPSCLRRVAGDRPDGYLLNNQGLGFLRLSADGVMWRSRRISWDGFSELRLEGQRLFGQAWSPFGDAWLPFELDVRTGETEGGSYIGPPMELGN